MIDGFMIARGRSAQGCNLAPPFILQSRSDHPPQSTEMPPSDSVFFGLHLVDMAHGEQQSSGKPRRDCAVPT
jgi:hypothetical protein